MGVVRVAAVQSSPVFLDRDATLDKTASLVAKAAGGGANLVVLPETFVPTYPDWVWRTKPWDQAFTALTALLIEQSVAIPSDACDRLGGIAAESGVVLSVGVNERDGSTLYNTQLTFGSDGTLLARHRKLMPTGGERLVWGMGDGSTLSVVDTPLGRIGGLTCWENYMPLARAALYAKGIDIYLAPTWDNSDVWVPSMRHIAKEGRVHVVSVNFCMKGSDVPAAVPHRDALYGGDDDWLSKGNSVIVGPNGDILAGPLTQQDGILFADIDPVAAAAERVKFDPSGHYSRPDVLRLVVDERAKPAVEYHAGDPSA